VIVGEHGWWQACTALGSPGYATFGSESANFNLLVSVGVVDPISGTASHRACLCEVRKVAARATT
jgi:hypothetical protein